VVYVVEDVGFLAGFDGIFAEFLIKFGVIAVYAILLNLQCGINALLK